MVVTRSGEDTAIRAGTTTPSRHIGAETGTKMNGQGSPWISRKSIVNGVGKETKETQRESQDAEDVEDSVDVGTIKLGELNLKEDEDEGMEMDEEEDVKDIDDETLQNTRINEYMCITPRRMLRRRATSRLNSTNRNRDPNSSGTGAGAESTDAESSSPKRVKFADEPCSVRTLESHKAAWQST